MDLRKCKHCNDIRASLDSRQMIPSLRVFIYGPDCELAEHLPSFT